MGLYKMQLENYLKIALLGIFKVVTICRQICLLLGLLSLGLVLSITFPVFG